MIQAARLIVWVVVLTVLLTGPLAPLASAQQTASATEPEAMKKSAQEEADAYEAGSAVVNAFYVPGKLVLCGLGGVLGLGTLLISFGTGYKAAAAVAREGCGGKWTVTGEDLRPEQPPEWERR